MCLRTGSGGRVRVSGAHLTEKRARSLRRFTKCRTNRPVCDSKSTVIATLKRIDDATKPERIAARLVDQLPPAPGQDADSWRKVIINAYETAMESSAKAYPAFTDEVFGVHGFRLFRPEYGFKVILSLPGAIVESNATGRHEDRLAWAFKPEDFYFQDYVLRARSRIVHTERIAAAAAIFSVIVAILWSGRRRRTRMRANPSSH